MDLDFRRMPKIATLVALAAVFSSFGAGTISGQLRTWHFGIVVAGISLCVWIINHRRYRALADTPCSPIKSAPQGYIEVGGIGRPLAGIPLLSPLHALPCLWYRVLVEIRRDQKWEKDSEDESDASFILEDEDGSCCYVDPENAQVTTLNKDVVTEGNTRTTQWLLVSGTRIHVLGHFVTQNQSADRPALAEELREKLADWKASGESKRFDLDQDGELSLQEWDLARAAARREVERERRAAAAMPDMSRIIAPPDGRSFIITDLEPRKLAFRYRLGAWGALLVFFLALAGSAWLRSQGE